MYEHKYVYSDAAIIGSVTVIIGQYFYYRYRLFLTDVTDIVISVPIISFVVIITSLIVFMILIIEKMLIFIERMKVDIMSDRYWLSVHI